MDDLSDRRMSSDRHAAKGSMTPANEAILAAEEFFNRIQR
jgi:hypothetical protein